MQTNAKFRNQDGEKGEASKRFTYTAQRGGYVSIVSALLFLMVVEGGVIALLIAIFVLNVFIKMGLFSILGIFVFFMVGRVLAPLWTRHGVDARYVRLRYGFDFRADIARSTIRDARAVREKVGVIPWVRYEERKRRVVAAFSEKGQVLLRLEQAYPLRVGLFGRRSADEILINVDKRDEFLRMLDVLDRQSSGGGQERTGRRSQSGHPTAPQFAQGSSGEQDQTGTRPPPGHPTAQFAQDSPGKERDRTGTRPPPGHPTAPCPYMSSSPSPELALDSPLATISDTSAALQTKVLASADRSDSTRETMSGGKVGSKVAIRTEGLTRRYGDVVAVDGLDLRIHGGEIYGFLGANGAGKTTTMKMLVGLLEPDGGRVEIGGFDVWRNPLAAKAVLGYVGDRAMLYDRLTGREFLMFVAQMRGIPRRQAEGDIDGLLDMLELADRAGGLCATYSYGMKRKLALAAALLHRPSVLILDEPLNGLDPLSARRLKDLFGELAAGGTAIFLSTHDLATAESLCDRVGIIARGRLIVEGSADELRVIAAAPDLESVFLALTAGEEEVTV